MARSCVLDSSFIMSLTDAACFAVLEGNHRYDWFITPIVRGELRQKVNRDPVDAMIAAGQLHLAEIDMSNPVEVAEWTCWNAQVDPGEAEAITLVITRGWLVAMEDRRAQRALDRAKGAGRWINCANAIKDAVADGRWTAVDADAAFRSLDCYSAYQKRGIASLSQL